MRLGSSTEIVPLDPLCELVLDQGSCRDYSIRWYYDRTANACAQFWYGGCHGNRNRFDTEDECKKTCVVPRIGTHTHTHTLGVALLLIFTIKPVIHKNSLLVNFSSLKRQLFQAIPIFSQ